MKLNELLASIERDVPITLIFDEQYFRVGKKGDLLLIEYTMEMRLLQMLLLCMMKEQKKHTCLFKLKQ